MKYIGLFLAISEVAAHFHEGPPPPHHHHHMSPLERDALNKIEEVCQDDMERHCRPSEEAMSDPLLKWMMAPERLAPPMVHPQALEPMDPINIGPLLDHMMDTALRLPMMHLQQPEPEPVFFLMIENSPPEEQPSEEFVLDSMVSRLMQQSDCQKNQLTEQVQQDETGEEEEPVNNVIHHIRLKGQEVLEQENVPEDRRRLARRLTEVTPEEMMVHFQQPLHPFFHHQPSAFFHQDFTPPRRENHHICPRKHKCLMQARDQNKLQPGCHGAVTRLETIQTNKAKEMSLYMNLFWFYCILFFSLFTMIIMRRFKGSKGLFLLRLRILQAVYSNPEIKAKVEDEVGAPLGDVPPLPSVGLKMLSREGRTECRAKRQRFCRMLYVVMAFFALDAFGVLPDCWPLIVMGACCCFMIVRMLTLCCSEPEIRECKCCCCGGSTLDVENGMVSEAQACCTCCKGSGICAPKCKSCCGGGDEEGTGTCCGGTCSCAKDHGCNGGCGCCGDPETALGYTLMKADDCKCCCCGATTIDVAKGVLTDVQSCCTCCKGTGTCSAGCKKCCGKGGKSKNGTGTCCGGNCSCAKEHGCNGGCGCCGSPETELGCTLMEGDDCKCCCCGATTVDAAKGVLTDVQACCTCCKGTGTCSAGCKKCCGKGGKKKNGTGTCCGGSCSCAKDKGCNGGCDCCGSKTVVYHGVPIQIV